MQHKILEVTDLFVTGVSIDHMSGCEWIVVADIPRYFNHKNKRIPQNISILKAEKIDFFSDDIEVVWSTVMANRFKEWLMRYHPEKLNIEI